MKYSNINHRLSKIIHKPNSYLHLLAVMKTRCQWSHRIAPYSWTDDKYWLEYYFLKHFTSRLDLKNPKTFNEKIQWMKLNDRNPLYTKLADKYLVRDYVKEKIGLEYLNKLFSVYNKTEDIIIEKLNCPCVLLANRSSAVQKSQFNRWASAIYCVS